MNISISTPLTLTEQKVAVKKSTAFWEYLEYNRFGFTPAILVLVLCCSGIAAAMALKYSMIMLILVGASSLIVEALLIAIVSMRTVFFFAAIAILIDIFVYINFPLF